MKAEARHSEIHGTGLFAIEEIEKDEPFLEYVGHHLNDQQLWDQFYSTYGDNYKPGDFMSGRLKFVRVYTSMAMFLKTLLSLQTIPVKKTAKLFLKVIKSGLQQSETF